MITLAEIKRDWLNIDATDTQEDATITALIGQASAMIESICNQPIIQTTLQVGFSDATGYSHILGYTVPFTVNSMRYKTSPTGAWVTIDPTAFIRKERSIWLGTKYIYGYTYEATITIGYTVIPKDIVAVCAELVVALWKRTTKDGSSHVGVQSIAVAQGGMTTTTIISDIMPSIHKRLARYQARWI